jgi:hypothetical protein
MPCDLLSRRLTGACVRLVGPLVVLLLPAIADGQLKHPDLQKIVRDAISNREVTIQAPRIEVRNGTLYCQLGGGHCVLNPNLEAWDPMNSVVDAQLCVEVLRQNRSEPRQREFWEPVLRRVEEVISQQLDVVQDARVSEKERENRVGELSGKIGDIYEEAIASYAKLKGVKVGKILMYRPPHAVKLVTSPAGGRIFLSHAIQMRMAQMQKKEPEWRLIADPSKVELEGKYYYLVQWGDRTKKSDEPILIDRTGTFVLR